MACCPDRTIGAIETGDFASSLTQKRGAGAVRCGYSGRMNRYPARCDSRCDPLPKPLIGAIPESVALANRVASCKNVDVAHMPKTSQQYTRDLQLAVVECEDRFGKYTRKFVAPCPPVSAEYRNSTLPKPSFNVCQPTRQ